MIIRQSICSTVLALALAVPASAQQPPQLPDPQALAAAQKAALAPLAWMHGVWREVGDRIVEGAPPMRFFEMSLKRISDSDWPAAGAVPRRCTLRGGRRRGL